MWTRAELKRKAKETLKKYYWKMVLVSLLFSLLCGGAEACSSSGGSSSNSGTANTTETVITNEDSNIIVEETQDVNLDNFLTTDRDKIVAITVAMIIFLIVFVVIMAVVILIDAFVFNPLEAGIRRFFAKSLYEDTKIREIAYTFDHGYLNAVKVIFFRDLYLVLWTLLFIIPGIVKAYEYRMIPYIIGENPELTKEEVFARSKEMMKGQKFKAFVLDLSFIGWGILSVMTLGILAVFYVAPYENLTMAALYNKLSGNDTEWENEVALPEGERWDIKY